jgi:hypothetical protein
LRKVENPDAVETIRRCACSVHRSLFLLKTAERHDSPDRLPVETPFACISVSENQMSDPYDLQRFIAAQNPVYDKVCSELRDGSKKTHWMWFIF